MICAAFYRDDGEGAAPFGYMPLPKVPECGESVRDADGEVLIIFAVEYVPGQGAGEVRLYCAAEEPD